LLVQDLIDLLPEGDGELGNCRGVLDKILELGVKWLKVDGDGEIDESVSVTVVEERELVSLRKLILDQARVFDSLCGNIHRQIRHLECEDSGEGSGELEEEDVRVLRGIQRTVQAVHLDAMRDSLESGDAEGAVSHIRSLHFDYGVEEQSEYRYASFCFFYLNLMHAFCLENLDNSLMKKISFPFDIIVTTAVKVLWH